jgi:hypothetical protein
MEAKPDQKIERHNMNSDPWLAMVVELSTKMADSTQGNAETEITLQVSGMLVSGYIISTRQFLLEHPLTDRLLEEIDRQNRADATASPNPEKNQVEFIHLRDTRFYTPGQPPIPTSGPGTFWRCRLSDVSGFHFGILKVGPPSSDAAAEQE